MTKKRGGPRISAGFGGTALRVLHAMSLGHQPEHRVAGSGSRHPESLNRVSSHVDCLSAGVSLTSWRATRQGQFQRSHKLIS